MSVTDCVQFPWGPVRCIQDAGSTVNEEERSQLWVTAKSPKDHRTSPPTLATTSSLPLETHSLHLGTCRKLR